MYRSDPAVFGGVAELESWMVQDDPEEPVDSPSELEPEPAIAWVTDPLITPAALTGTISVMLTQPERNRTVAVTVTPGETFEAAVTRLLGPDPWGWIDYGKHLTVRLVEPDKNGTTNGR